MSGKGIKKGMARTGKVDKWAYSSKKWGKRIWGKLHRQGNKSIIRDELKEIDND